MNYLRIGLCLVLLGCSTMTKPPPVTYGARLKDSPAVNLPRIPLVPKAKSLADDAAPIIQFVSVKSPAHQAGIKVGDLIVQVNGRRILTVKDFENELKKTRGELRLLIKRADVFISKTLFLGATSAPAKNLWGGSIEPYGMALTKKSSPFIAYIKNPTLTVYAQTTLSRSEDNLRLNLILDSDKFSPSSPLNYEIWDLTKNKLLARGVERIDLHAHKPQFFSRLLGAKAPLRTPIRVSVNLDRRTFQFEFQ